MATVGKWRGRFARRGLDGLHDEPRPGKPRSISDEDVACLLAPGHGGLTPQEQMAVEFIDLLSADHHAMDDEFYRRLGEHFTAAQIIELGFTCAGVMGLHRFIHTLNVYGDSAPVIEYDREQVDSAKPV